MRLSEEVTRDLFVSAKHFVEKLYIIACVYFSKKENRRKHAKIQMNTDRHDATDKISPDIDRRSGPCATADTCSSFAIFVNKKPSCRSETA